MGYGKLEHMFWENPDLRELGLECRAVAGYLLTSRHATSEGLYRLSPAYACADLDIDRPTLFGYLWALDLNNFARYDATSEVVFIRNALRFRPPRGPKSIAHALRLASDMPMHPFRTLFYDAAHQWAPDFAVALADAGWASLGGQAEPTLWERPTAPPAAEVPRAVPVPPPGDDPVEKILRLAASVSVQRSVVSGEAIRNQEAVAGSRLAKHRLAWTPLVASWLEFFKDVSPRDMANALVDGGTASPYWQRTSP